MRFLMFFIGAVLAALGKHFSVFGSDNVFAKLVDPAHFEKATLALLAIVGLLLMAATVQPLVFKSTLREKHSAIFASFCAVAGGIAGWAFYICVKHVVQGGLSVVPETLTVGLFAALLTLSPIYLYTAAERFFTSQSNWTVASRKSAWALQIAGFVIFVVATYGLARVYASGA